MSGLYDTNIWYRTRAVRKRRGSIIETQACTRHWPIQALDLLHRDEYGIHKLDAVYRHF